MNNESTVTSRRKGNCPHKRTDFRYELWVKERKSLRKKAKARSFKVEYACNRGAVTVDTSKARSTLEVVRLCLRSLCWREYSMGKKDGGLCDIYWHSVHFTDNADLQGGRVNKFPGMVETVRKINLSRMLDIMRSLYPSEYDFHPVSWFLPQQMAEFSDAVRRLHDQKKKPIFIVKPDEGSQGEGIYIIQHPSEYIHCGRHHVIQEYITKPLLLENLKFDLRVYVLLASLEPLEIYVCREGLARFCTVNYQAPSYKNIRDSYMHLTNYSLNKRSTTYLHTESDEDGSKRTMSSVFNKLQHEGYNTNEIWLNIQRLVVKTIVAMVPDLKVEMRAAIPPGKPGPQPFQILGFDVLLDENATPLLLEVNANPSLRLDFENEVAPGIYEHIHSPVDEEIKKPLIMDTLLIVAPRTKSSMNKRRRALRHSAKASTRTLLGPWISNRDLIFETEFDSEDIGSESERAAAEDDDDSGDPVTQEVLIPHRGYNSLEQIFPNKFYSDYQWLRLLERTVEIYLFCLGVRGALRMGSTGFRTFTRRCGLTTGQNAISNAEFDILYIDIRRRWDLDSNDNSRAGLCFQGFLEAFFQISRRRFPSSFALSSVEALIEHCEYQLDFDENHKPRSTYNIVTLPKISRAEKNLGSGLLQQQQRKKTEEYRDRPEDKINRIRTIGQAMRQEKTFCLSNPVTPSNALPSSARFARSPMPPKQDKYSAAKLREEMLEAHLQKQTAWRRSVQANLPKSADSN